MKKLFLVLGIGAMALLMFFHQPRIAGAVAVDLELMLLVDVSGSVDVTEYNLQKNGYVTAFQNATIQNLISSLPGGIAVAYAEWGGATSQSMVVNWTHITDAASSNAFASLISNSSRALGGSTAPGSAINWGVPLFTNGFEGTRFTMDISGDGRQNAGANTFAAATAAFAAGIILNGLAIETDDPNLGDWYLDNIVTPGGGFLVTATDFLDFQDAIYEKIYREIQVPEPATLLLLSAGFIGLAGMSRRMRKK